MSWLKDIFFKEERIKRPISKSKNCVESEQELISVQSEREYVQDIRFDDLSDKFKNSLLKFLDIILPSGRTQQETNVNFGTNYMNFLTYIDQAEVENMIVEETRNLLDDPDIYSEDVMRSGQFKQNFVMRMIYPLSGSKASQLEEIDRLAHPENSSKQTMKTEANNINFKSYQLNYNHIQSIALKDNLENLFTQIKLDRDHMKKSGEINESRIIAEISSFAFNNEHFLANVVQENGLNYPIENKDPLNFYLVADLLSVVADKNGEHHLAGDFREIRDKWKVNYAQINKNINHGRFDDNGNPYAPNYRSQSSRPDNLTYVKSINDAKLSLRQIDESRELFSSYVKTKIIEDKDLSKEMIPLYEALIDGRHAAARESYSRLVFEEYPDESSKRIEVLRQINKIDNYMLEYAAAIGQEFEPVFIPDLNHDQYGDKIIKSSLEHSKPMVFVEKNREISLENDYGEKFISTESEAPMLKMNETERAFWTKDLTMKKASLNLNTASDDNNVIVNVSINTLLAMLEEPNLTFEEAFEKNSSGLVLDDSIRLSINKIGESLSNNYDGLMGRFGQSSQFMPLVTGHEQSRLVIDEERRLV